MVMNRCHVISRLRKNISFSRYFRFNSVFNSKSMAESQSSNADDVTDPKRKQFGNRLLTDPKNVFEHNAWDNVVWDEAQENEAKMKADEQLKHPASEEDQARFEAEADKLWDQFYGKHENKFFKDRQWLFTEFPELAPEFYLPQKHQVEVSTSDSNCAKGEHSESDFTKGDNSNENKVKTVNITEVSEKSEMSHTQDNSSEDVVIKGNERETINIDESSTASESTECKLTENETYPGESAHYRIFEVGCGVGNTVFPILQANNDPQLMVYCCDFSTTAVNLVKENKDYNPRRCRAFVCDISDPNSAVPFPDESLDIIILIFVFSAINPDKFQAVMNRLSGFLKPGGTILFRDYGRYDMAQLRFKKGRCLSENFYARGDGTRVYFFTQDELREMMTKAGLLEKQNYVDRRLQVNRGRQLKMYRVWIQCKYVKPERKVEGNERKVEESENKLEESEPKVEEDESGEGR